MDSSRYDDPWGTSQEKSYSNNKKQNIYNIEDFFKKFEKTSNNIFKSGGGFNKKFIFVIAVIVLLFWVLSGFYVVNPEEEGVELIFGKYVNTSEPGLRYNFPYPIGNVTKVKVASINREEIGFAVNKKGEGEGIMLTGDENIVNVNFEVQWRIKNAYDFLYKVRDDIPGMSVKSAAESAMRDSIGQNKIAFILRGEGRSLLAIETKELLQKILDAYSAGVEILSIQMKKVDPPEKVINAFRDVQSARADKEREINQAYTYKNDILPRAKGDAEKIMKSSEAYKIEVVNRAEGDTKRFTEIYQQYKNNKEITKNRIYLETLEEIYKGSDKILLDNKSAIPFLDLMKK
jgi:membrane protease subunit HflK